MAKIIKHGKLYNKEITCEHCGCVFIPDKSDYHYPVIDANEVCDDGEVHLTELKKSDIKDLPGKNKLDKFFLNAETYEYLQPVIECPECGDNKMFNNELVLFDFFGNGRSDGEEIWVTDDTYLQQAIRDDYFDDDSPAWNVERMLVREGEYTCLQLNVKTGQYKKVKIPVKRPDIQNHRDIYDHIKEIVMRG
jgi:rubredoxin